MYALDVVCFEKPFRFTRGSMRRFAEAKKARVVIAEESDVLVGFVILDIEETEYGRVGYINTLDVAPELRRRGIAGVLMSEAERQAQMDGCTALVLHVFTGNEAAIRFYAGMGYVRSHREEGFYGPGVDAWEYHKLLLPLNE
jgi:ribosomal-protein-alanine N-acetyltransferase